MTFVPPDPDRSPEQLQTLPPVETVAPPIAWRTPGQQTGLTAEEILRVIENEVPGPRHTAGVDFFDDDDEPQLRGWCSCGWGRMSIPLPAGTDPDRLPMEPVETLARAWRQHVRLSNLIYAIDRRLRRDAARDRARAEEEE